jgi:hypothetical protein
MVDNQSKQIHVIYKTHLDVGFTDFARNIVKQYIDHYIPKALNMAKQLRESGLKERFIWTTGSWIIYEYLEKADAKERALMEAAINAGDIRWHAMPFTTHTELMDSSLFRYGIGLSKQLDRRFDKKTIAGKMSDVPGHTRAIIPILKDAGIEFLHIGCNPALTPPSVPPVFKWRDQNQSELMVMYQVGYGSYMEVPGIKHALLFEHTNDNLGPQTMEEVLKGYQKIRNNFPDATVFASDLNTFALELKKCSDTLPTVTEEIGDTWIHGVGTDPKKVAQFRVLQRVRKEWYDRDNIIQSDLSDYEKQIDSFNRSLFMVPEHTWGMDIKTHLKDTAHYCRDGFEGVRQQEAFKKVEASWQEQRDYIINAVEAVQNTPLYSNLERELNKIEPGKPDLRGYKEISQEAPVLHTDNYEISFHTTGALCFLRDKRWNKTVFDHENVAGQFYYQAFTDKDYNRFHSQYLKDHADWALYDNGKPGLPKESHYVTTHLPILKEIWQYGNSDRFMTNLCFDEITQEKYGCPKEIYMEWNFQSQENKIEVTLQWFSKSANRLPEAYWLSFNPVVADAKRWKLMKMGQKISPFDIIENGNKKLHCVDDKVVYEDAFRRITVETLDAPLVAPGEPSLLDFNNEQPDMNKGMAFNLLNNVWGTNFPMWYEDDAKFRFYINY